MRRENIKNLQKRTIAVFGASSNIAGKFIREAVDKRIKIVAFARDTSRIPVLPKQRAKESIEIVQGDITNLKDVCRVFKGRHIDASINFAASFSADIEEAKAVNVLGEKNVLDASSEFDVKRHIYISTIATLIPKPNAYGDTKRQAEEVIKKTGKKLDWIILRFPCVLGTRAWDQPFKLIVPFVRLAVPKIPTDARDAAFLYVTIETAVNATLAALDAQPNQTITVFDGETTIGEFLSAMEEVYNIRRSFLPSQFLWFLDKLFGKYVPGISEKSSAVEFLAHLPALENETMRKELQVKTRDFGEWMRRHFKKNIGRKT